MTTALFVAALALIVAGVALIYFPAALIAGGLSLGVIAVLDARQRAAARDREVMA